MGTSYKIFHYSTVTFEQTVLVFFEIDLPILLTAEKTRVVVQFNAPVSEVEGFF